MQPVQHYQASLLVHGVFEKFPDLRLIVKETGVAWVPWFFWELDAAEPILRRESTCLKRRPSDYFRKHLRLSTQPLEEPARSEQLIEILEAVGGMDDILCFSTNYPHHDTHDPGPHRAAAATVMVGQGFYTNALAVYGWADTGQPRTRPHRSASG